MTLAPTPGQTVGPFFHYALPYEGDSDLVPIGAPGAIRLHGTVADGAGAPVIDAIIEVWQAGPDGRVVRAAGSLHRDGYTFTGFGRAATDRAGHYSFTTLTPGGVDGGLPFFALTVFARGLTHRLNTRAYLPVPDGADDALLRAAGQRRRTLLTTADADGYRFDVHFQGPDETVFLTTPGERVP
ncbi:protocatechuate 3,4-dioxygenase subunit alpha [Kineococcus rhizosphaerae]|uniref:Protocatechuate 3,4-dioxygenase alpha subunit n=1 Tax=Kineococcus rhizosphaerae TaxID=559628 RepID=A0A2T0R3M5_9ACTN|nr:protocatechuate 3,4-dioxygenase subunit alpha [Kineococcus rhizosphaerae]PRY14635.1 protocatechuate 3,4-dioxygenase alpha subunit [Kineococcus rhizosphaerae]